MAELETVDAAVNAVAAEIEPIAKSEKSGGGYSYRGIDRVLDALAPIMAKHKVTVVPCGVENVSHEWVETSTRGGGSRTESFTQATYLFQVRGPRGNEDAYQGSILSHGMNDRDKSAGSGASYAYRYFVSFLFRIPTGAGDNEDRNEPVQGRGASKKAKRPSKSDQAKTKAKLNEDAKAAGWKTGPAMTKARQSLITAISAAKSRDPEAFDALRESLAHYGYLNEDGFVPNIPTPALIENALKYLEEGEPPATVPADDLSAADGAPDEPAEDEPADEAPAVLDDATPEQLRKMLAEFITGVGAKKAKKIKSVLEDLGDWPLKDIPDENLPTVWSIARAAADEGAQ